MRLIEQEADGSGLTNEKMMENAGLNLTREVAQLAYARDDEDGIRVLGLVGSGNNGGHTLVALAHLAGKGPLGFAAMRKKIGTTPLLFLNAAILYTLEID